MSTGLPIYDGLGHTKYSKSIINSNNKKSIISIIVGDSLVSYYTFSAYIIPRSRRRLPGKILQSNIIKVCDQIKNL